MGLDRTESLGGQVLALPPISDEQLLETGLTAQQIEQRINLGATNNQDFEASRSLRSILRSNLLSLFNAVVGGAFLLLLALGQWKDALFGFAVVFNILIGIIQEYRSKRTLDRLALLSQPSARVRRDSQTIEINIANVVIDDLLVLRAGDEIPADGSILESAGLEIDESLLTGEAEPVGRIAGDTILSGSLVVGGSGLARVVRVGKDTYANQLTTEARRFSMVKSELRGSLAKIIRWITWALIPIMVIVLNGQMQAVGGWGFAFESGRWVEALVGATASIISMIPQGLVLITSISFAVAAARLASRKVLVQELAAVEGLARVDVICFDKTGTLTEGELQFTDAILLSSAPTSKIDWQSVLAVFASDANANATTRALGGAFENRQQLAVLSSVPFSSEHKWSSFTFQFASDEPAEQWVLGAPEMLLTANDSATVAAAEAAHALAETGLRTLLLSVASAEPFAQQEVSEAKRRQLENLRPVALITFSEQVRADAAKTLEYFASQNVSVRIISGDNPRTVAAVARQAGLEHAGSGFDARELPSDLHELAEVLENNLVFGRVTPEQKKLMVHALQERGHVVAMTGDGVNDALALKHADLGIAMGSGAAATKSVSRIILLDGKFSSLPGVVAEGRRVIANVERVSRLFLTKTAWAMMLAIFFGLALWSFPFLPRQLSAMDGYTIGLPAFALALLPNTRRYIPGFLKRSLLFCIPSGFTVALAVIVFSILLRSEAFVASGWNTAESQTAVSILMSVAGMWVLVTLARPLDLRRWGIVVVMYLVFIGVFVIAPIAEFFGFVSLTPEKLTLPLVLAVATAALIELIHRMMPDWRASRMGV